MADKPRFQRSGKKPTRVTADVPKAPPGFVTPDSTGDTKTGKPRSRAALENVNAERQATELRKLQHEKQRLDDQLLMTEWALTGGRIQVFTWLQEVKGFSLAHARFIVTRRPIPQWSRILEYVQNNYSNNLVKRHMESAAQANDQHMMAARLGMAKAMEFLSKLTIEEAIDKNGNPYFKKFRTTDLKNCMESIMIAQKITRVALGLPTDEGSVHIWQKIQQSFGTNPMPEDTPTETVVEGEPIKDQVMRLQKSYTYDEIKEMVSAFKNAGLTGDATVIDTETTK